MSRTPDDENGPCVLVNVGRGRCVDAAAVYTALDRGELYAFASDVWWKYPKNYEDALQTPPTDASGSLDFAQVRGVTLSGHRGGAPQQQDTEERRLVALSRALNHAARAGDVGLLSEARESLIGRVDLHKGY